MRARAQRGTRRRGLLAALVTAAAVLLPVSAAQAHDAVEGSDPANGSTVAMVPAEVRITLDHTPIAIGSEIAVKDSSGTNWAEGNVQIVDNVVSQALRAGAPAGAYTVVWRVVSSDSHPIEGTFTFTARTAAGGTSSGGTTTAAVPSSAASPSAAPVAAGSSSAPWPVVGAAAGIAVLVSLLALLVRRRLRQPDDGGAGETPAGS